MICGSERACRLARSDGACRWPADRL